MSAARAGRRGRSALRGVLLVSLLAAAAALDRKVAALARARGVDDAAAARVAPGEFLGTVCAGGLRPLAIDILWYRYIERQDSGELYETPALADLIVELQPHLDIIWDFHAWNLAYNVAALEPTEEAKWKWIRQGIVFLRRGIERNPENPHLEFYLGWIYFDRCWRQSPDACARLLGDPEVDRERLGALGQALRWFALARTRPGHRAPYDFRVVRIRQRQVEENAGLPPARRYLSLDRENVRALREEVRAILDHVLEEHPDVPAYTVEAIREDFEATLVESTTAPVPPAVPPDERDR